MVQLQLCLLKRIDMSIRNLSLALAAVLVGAVSFAAPVAGQIQKCKYTDTDGSVVYTDSANCGQTVSAPTAGDPTVAAPAPQPKQPATPVRPPSDISPVNPVISVPGQPASMPTPEPAMQQVLIDGGDGFWYYLWQLIYT